MERWDHDIPPIFSGETIIADSLTESLCRMGRNDLAKRYNYSSLYAIFLAHHKDAFRQMMKFVIKKPIRMMWLIKGIVVRPVSYTHLDVYKRQVLQEENTI